MTQYKDFFSLSHEVKLYVPSTQGLSGRIDTAQHAKRVKEVAEKMASLFGGATTTQAQGYYVAGNSSLVVEDIEIVYSGSTTEAWEQASQTLLDYTQEECREWDQER